MFVNLAVADAGKSPGPFQPGAESPDPGEHVEESDYILFGHGEPPSGWFVV